MNEIVTQIADRVGIAPDLAEKALGMMLGFLQREAADGPVAKMIEAIPGGADLVAQFNGAGAGGGGLLGGLMSSLGGGGIMASTPFRMVRNATIPISRNTGTLFVEVVIPHSSGEAARYSKGRYYRRITCRLSIIVLHRCRFHPFSEFGEWQPRPMGKGPNPVERHQRP